MSVDTIRKKGIGKRERSKQKLVKAGKKKEEVKEWRNKRKEKNVWEDKWIRVWKKWDEYVYYVCLCKFFNKVNWKLK